MNVYQFTYEYLYIDDEGEDIILRSTKHIEADNAMEAETCLQQCCEIEEVTITDIISSKLVAKDVIHKQ